MEITKVIKSFIRRGANTFGNIVYQSTVSDNTEISSETPDWDLGET